MHSRSHPYLGSVEPEEISSDPLGFLLSVTRQHGDIVSYESYGRSVTLLNHPSYARHVLQSNAKNYTKENTPDLLMLSPMLGQGLMTSVGDSWQRQRRQLQPLFHRHRVESWVEVMGELADETVEKWRDWQGSASPLDVSDEMTQLTVRILCRTLFGTDLPDQSGNFSEAVAALNQSMAHYDPFDANAQRRFQEARAELRAMAESIVGQRRGCPYARDDMLASLFGGERNEGESGEAFDRRIKDQVVTFLMAGHETTAKSLTWTFYLLSQFPEVAEKTRREIDFQLGDGEPTAKELDGLEYCRKVHQEAMRLYPPVWSMTRTSCSFDEIDGYEIPAGELVVVSPYALHRHQDFWDQPDSFIPDRFGASHEEECEPFRFIPFSGGSRVCIGRHFATLETRMILAKIVRNFSLSRPQRGPVEPEALVTLCPKGGMPLWIEGAHHNNHKA